MRPTTTKRNEIIASAFSKAAPSYDAIASAQRWAGKALMDRFQLLKFHPKKILDLGCGTGYFTQRLASQFPEATLVGVDIAFNMVRHASSDLNHRPLQPTFAQGDALALPFPDSTFDCVFSNIVLHWCNDWPGAFREIRRILKPKGLLLFSTVGPETLKEVRAAWEMADNHSHVDPFSDIRTIGDHLTAQQFLNPVLTQDQVVLTYQNPASVLKELKQLGSKHLGDHQRTGLLGKQRYGAFLKAYEAFREKDGLLPLTYEIILGHGFSSDHKAINSPEEIRISVDDIQRFN